MNLRLLISRITVTVSVMLFTHASWGQAIYLDGHKAVHETSRNLWLCSVPQEVFGTDWTATVEVDSTWSCVTINGIEITSGDQVTLPSVAGGKRYPFTAQCDGTTISGNITFTWLPVLELNGEFSDEYSDGTVSLITPDTADIKTDMLARLKWRGGITNNPNKHKHNYSIKFVDEEGNKKNRRLLGLRKDNHWKLDAGQIDPLRIRNRVSTDLWLDMSRNPWHMEMDSSVINGSRGKVTEVLLNGEYYGIYSLIEPVDRKQLALIKYDETEQAFHGQQWASKTYAATWRFPMYNNYSDTWNGNEVNYPEFDDVNPTDWSTLYSAFEFVRKCDSVDDYETLTDSLDYYFDIPVMEDYFIFITVLQALDNETKNIYYSCYDRTLGAPRLTLTPWDLDISTGALSINSLNADLVKPDRPLNWINHVPMGDMFNHSEPHRKEIIKRYWQLRNTWLDTESLVSRFQTAVDELEQCGAAAREEARWSQDSDIDYKVLDISKEMAYVANWIRQRMAYLDENVFVREGFALGDINLDGDIDVADVTMLISTILNGGECDPDVADINNDSAIDVADVTALISLILNI